MRPAVSSTLTSFLAACVLMAPAFAQQAEDQLPERAETPVHERQVREDRPAPPPQAIEGQAASSLPHREPVNDIQVPTSETPDARALCEPAVAERVDGNAIQFASGSAALTEDSRAVLEEIAEILALCPETPVYVEGHTDSQGMQEANLRLSLARAEAVVDILVEHGIAAARLYAIGYGSSLPVASNDTAAGRTQNRRIVFSFEDMATPIASGGQ